MADKDLVDYFIKHTNERLSAIDKKMDTLIAFKWQIIGGAGAASIVVTLLIQFAMEVLKHKQI